MAFLNEQGVKTLWEKVKANTASQIEANNETINDAIEAVDAKIPTKLANPQALNFKDKDNNAIETYDGSNEINVKAGNNIVISENTSGDVVISATLTGVTVENAQHAATADEATKAKQDGSGNVITTTYATKAELNSHIQNKENPHEVTKAQVGLSEVENKSSATIRGELTSENVTKALGFTPQVSGNYQPAGNYATTTALADAEAKINKIVNGETPAGKVSNSLTIKLKDNTTAYDGSAAKTIDITPAAIGAQPAGNYQAAGNYQPAGDYATQDELDALSTTVDSKAPLASPAFTGTPTAPTAATTVNNTQIATTAFVHSLFRANDAMIFKGVINSNSNLPATHDAGWTYKVGTAGTYAGQKCEVGDLIICVTDGTATNNAHWSVIQNNIDGAVTSTATSTTDGNIPVFSGTTGKIIKDSGTSLANLTTILGDKLEDVTITTDDNDNLTISKEGTISGGTPHLAEEDGVTCNITLYTIPDSFFNSEFFN